MKCEMITATSLPAKLSSIVKNVKKVLKTARTMTLPPACCEISLDQVVSFTTYTTLPNTAQITQSSIL